MAYTMFQGLPDAVMTELMKQARALVQGVSTALQHGDDLSPEVRDKVAAVQALPGLPKDFTTLSLDGALHALIELVREDTLRRV